jgi:hypothetical protein
MGGNTRKNSWLNKWKAGLADPDSKTQTRPADSQKPCLSRLDGQGFFITGGFRKKRRDFCIKNHRHKVETLPINLRFLTCISLEKIVSFKKLKAPFSAGAKPVQFIQQTENPFQPCVAVIQ